MLKIVQLLINRRHGFYYFLRSGYKGFPHCDLLMYVWIINKKIKCYLDGSKTVVGGTKWDKIIM